MKREILWLILILSLLHNISASCNETQININIANLTDLDKITGIGVSKAQAIIDSRPFNSIDDLINVKGIGNKTIDKIKEQKLACVDEDNSENKINYEEKYEQEKEIANQENTIKPRTQEIILPLISLSQNPQNSKDIKSGNNKESLKRNLAISGIIIFCIFFGALFLLKSAREKKKNEFR